LILLRLLFFKKFPQAFLTAKIIMSTVYSFPNGSSLRNIGLATGVLNKFLWLRFPGPFFSPHGHVFNQGVKNHVKDEEKEDE
jgi:hypothetical protein